MSDVARPIVIAHRTCPLQAPENSLAGIAEAARQGADAVEVDVRCTRDGVAVLFHDRFPLRTARWPLPVALTSFDRMSQALAQHSPEGLVSLAQALAACPPDLRPTLDIKMRSAVDPTIAAVRESGRHDVMLWHREAAYVHLLREALPGAETALLRNTRDEAATLRYIDDAAGVGASAVSLHKHSAVNRTVEYTRVDGMLVYVWIGSEDGHRRVLDLGVDGINTDWVRTGRALVDGH